MSVRKQSLSCRDLGAHIDGFVATAAHTLVVQADEEATVTGKAADVIAAASTALDAAIRLIRPGKKISEVITTKRNRTAMGRQIPIVIMLRAACCALLKSWRLLRLIDLH